MPRISNFNWKHLQSFLTFFKRLIVTHRRSLLLLLIGVYLPLQVFGELAEDVWENEGGFRWDVPILLAIHSTANLNLMFLLALSLNWAYFGVCFRLLLWLRSLYLFVVGGDR
jgi:undecaprenyl-diphosphatase